MWDKGKWVKVSRNLKCLHCGIDFITTDSRKKYCSDTCKYNFNGKKYKARHSNTLEYYLSLLIGKKERRRLSVTDLLNLYNNQEGKCALSGRKLTWIQGHGKIRTNISIDRIEPGKEYTIENIRLVCDVVNRMRNDMNDDNLLYWCESILEHKNRSFSRNRDGSLKRNS